MRSAAAKGRLKRQLFRDRCFGYVVELGKLARQICVALGLHFGLPGSGSARRAIAIPAVKRSNHLHANRDLAEWREAPGIKSLVVVVIDEHLGRACIGTSGREGDESRLVALGDRIVLDVGFPPLRRHLRIAVNSKLHHESLDDAEETIVVVKAVLDEVVEAVGADRCPVAMNLDHKRALAGVEFCLVDRRRLFVERGGIRQRAVNTLRKNGRRAKKRKQKDNKSGHVLSWMNLR